MPVCQWQMIEACQKVYSCRMRFYERIPASGDARVLEFYISDKMCHAGAV